MDEQYYRSQVNSVLMNHNQKYFLEQLLDFGAQGAVYKAINRTKNQVVALKLQASISDQELQVLEYLIHRQNQFHYNIRMYEYFRRQSYICVIMEYANGGSLYKYLQNNPIITESDSLDIMKQLALGVTELHQNQIIHRDIKPENVVIFNENGRSSYKLCDIGLMKLQIPEFIDKMLAGTGTLQFQAPEMIDSMNYDEKVDVWALGVLYYELILKKQLFEGNSDLDTHAQIRHCADNPQLLHQKINQSNISEDQKSKLEIILQVIPQKRLEISKVLQLFQSKQQSNIKIVINPQKAQNSVAQPELRIRQVEPTDQLLQQQNKQTQMRIIPKNIPQNLPQQEIQQINQNLQMDDKFKQYQDNIVNLESQLAQKEIQIQQYNQQKSNHLHCDLSQCYEIQIQRDKQLQEIYKKLDLLSFEITDKDQQLQIMQQDHQSYIDQITQFKIDIEQLMNIKQKQEQSINKNIEEIQLKDGLNSQLEKNIQILEQKLQEQITSYNTSVNRYNEEKIIIQQIQNHLADQDKQIEGYLERLKQQAKQIKQFQNQLIISESEKVQLNEDIINLKQIEEQLNTQIQQILEKNEETHKQQITEILTKQQMQVNQFEEEIIALQKYLQQDQSQEYRQTFACQRLIYNQSEDKLSFNLELLKQQISFLVNKNISISFENRELKVQVLKQSKELDQIINMKQAKINRLRNIQLQNMDLGLLQTPKGSYVRSIYFYTEQQSEQQHLWDQHLDLSSIRIQCSNEDYQILQKQIDIKQNRITKMQQEIKTNLISLMDLNKLFKSQIEQQSENSAAIKQVRYQTNVRDQPITFQDQLNCIIQFFSDLNKEKEKQLSISKQYISNHAESNNIIKQLSEQIRNQKERINQLMIDIKNTQAQASRQENHVKQQFQNNYDYDKYNSQLVKEYFLQNQNPRDLCKINEDFLKIYYNFLEQYVYRAKYREEEIKIPKYNDAEWQSASKMISLYFNEFVLNLKDVINCLEQSAFQIQQILLNIYTCEETMSSFIKEWVRQDIQNWCNDKSMKNIRQRQLFPKQCGVVQTKAIKINFRQYYQQ